MKSAFSEWLARRKGMRRHRIKKKLLKGHTGTHDSDSANPLSSGELVVSEQGEKQRLRTEESPRLARKPQEEEDKHLAKSTAQLQLERPADLVTNDGILRSLHPCQRAALEYVRTRAKEYHLAALPALQKRAQVLGYDEKVLHRALQYIRDDAPIVIHLKKETLALLVKDTHYRSLFETHRSGGANSPKRREKWEAALFGKSYEIKCEPSMRPKYGCLNFRRDVAGVASATSRYGKLYMTLASSVRHRATFSDVDTSYNPKAPLATNDWYAHVLARYPDSDLTALLRVVQNEIVNSGTSKCGQYKEVQIHGPICLATDVHALSVPGRASEADAALRKTVEEFQKKTGCNVLWQEDRAYSICENDELEKLMLVMRNWELDMVERSRLTAIPACHAL